jgi:hypothetical protein
MVIQYDDPLLSQDEVGILLRSAGTAPWAGDRRLAGFG